MGSAETSLSARTQRPIRLLVFTTLYPNAAQPRHGVFVEERLRKLVASGRVTASVVAPVPWFPFRQPRFGSYAKFAAAPRDEERFGIHIEHPRYPVVPKVGMNLAPSLLYYALLPVLRRRAAAGDFDLVDAHYLYPDGVAAVRLGVAVRKPVVLSARGSDVTLIPGYAAPRRWIFAAARGAAAVITVSQDLNDRLVGLGVAPTKLTTVRNGVDLERFCPLPRDSMRAELGLVGTTWLTVGHLVEQKGVHLAIAALAQVPDATLLIAGDGVERTRLHQLTVRLGLAGRVRFLGAVAHDDLCRYYNAADALFHPSEREGMPNVVLEALACGTPVVAAPFDGAAEVIQTADAGIIAAERSADALVHAWQALQARMPERAATRRFAEEHLDWDAVVEAQCALYARVLRQHASCNIEGATP
ncbi:MAG TPA: glycosyltransferase [Rhodanobacteraceae bacterium]